MVGDLRCGWAVENGGERRREWERERTRGNTFLAQWYASTQSLKLFTWADKVRPNSRYHMSPGPFGRIETQFAWDGPAWF